MDGPEDARLLQDVVHLARLALNADREQVEAYVRRMSRTVGKYNKETASALAELVSEGSATRSLRDKGHRNAMRLVPVDQESRLDLLRVEPRPTVPHPPVLTPEVRGQIEQIIIERQRAAELVKANLEPSHTVLFTGPPGVGKTLTARWIAQRLRKPLFILDLAAVMSSLLGKTGSNLKAVLEYAKSTDGVLLLDEFDAVAKRRNDEAEVGELKRLVTVILQEIDLWPSHRLLIAATNHGELLDPAIWRRFDAVVTFPLPESADLDTLLIQELAGTVDEAWMKAMAILLGGRSFSDAARTLRGLRRQALLNGENIEQRLPIFVESEVASLSKADRKLLSSRLETAGLPQRRISELTGLSRDTIRRARPVEELSDG